MTIKEKINADFLTAFKAKDMVKKTFLGFVKSEIQAEEGRGTVSTDSNILIILRKIEKNLMMANTAESQNEISYLRDYLPEFMSEDKIKEILLTFKNDGIKNVGQMMGEFNKHYKGLADNNVVSNIAKEILI